MINQKRYVLIPTLEVTQDMLDNTIPYGINYEYMPVIINAVEYSILKWRGNKPLELWNEYPIYGNEELSDYISTNATLPPKPQPI